MTVSIYFVYLASASSTRTYSTFPVLNVTEMWHEHRRAAYNDDFLEPEYTFNFIHIKRF